MNKFRKPYVACIFALVLLFTSCSQYESQNEEVNASSLTNYVEKHIKMTSELYQLVENETDINAELLQDSTKNIDFDQLNSVLENANFTEPDKIANLLKEINDNTFLFIESNSSLSQKELESIISAEIDKILINESIYNKSNTCLDRLNIAKSRCLQNLILASAIAGASAFFTAGAGPVIGISAALLQNLICNGQANHDYEECIKNAH